MILDSLSLQKPSYSLGSRYEFVLLYLTLPPTIKLAEICIINLHKNVLLLTTVFVKSGEEESKTCPSSLPQSLYRYELKIFSLRFRF